MRTTPATAATSTHARISVRNMSKKGSTTTKTAWNAIAVVTRMKQSVSGDPNVLGQETSDHLIGIAMTRIDTNKMTTTEDTCVLVF